MVSNQNILDEIDNYLYTYEEGYPTQDSLNSIESLLRQASQDQKNNALNYVVKVGEPELVDLIIDLGADVNSVIREQTPLMAAIIDPDNHWVKQRNIVETLLDRGANPSEVVNEKTVDDVINSEINILRAKNNSETDIQTLENIKEMINQRRDRIQGGKRKRKQTKKKKRKKRKSTKKKSKRRQRK